MTEARLAIARRLLTSFGLAAAVSVQWGCEREVVPEPYVPSNAHDGYRHSLSEAGLLGTALGREWTEAADASLRSPVEVAAPFRESFYIDRAEAFAVGYSFEVARGQRTEIRLDVEPAADWRLFMDLFRVSEDQEGELVHVASGGEGDLRLAFEPRRDGVYLLRIQSELLRGGACTVEIRNVASLAFPVDGRDTRAIGSSFGAPREAGRRQHHGVDIFAPRHTEVRATSRARVRRVAEWKLGGLVVWLEDPERNLRLYFAHLQTQDVEEGEWVEPGDKIGTVGNSGNARTTPPHLHFGIYVRGEGPIDPYPFLHQPRSEPREVRADLERLGRWARTRNGAPASLLPRLHASSAAASDVPPGTPLRVLGGAASHYRVSLPNGIHGYVPERHVEDLSEPLDSLTVTVAAALRDRPAADAATVRNLPAGVDLDVFGSFGGYALVVDEERLAWLSESASPEPIATTSP